MVRTGALPSWTNFDIDMNDALASFDTGAASAPSASTSASTMNTMTTEQDEASASFRTAASITTERQPPDTFAPSSSSSSSSPPMMYCRLIAAQDWDAFRHALTSQEGRNSAEAEIEDSPHVDGGVLHFVCRFHPPLDVVVTVAECFPGCVERPDRVGRYPLHVASKWGASPKVVKYLIGRHMAVAGLQDAMGKTPLHLASEFYAEKYSSRKAEGRPVKEAMVEVTRMLCKASPATVNLEDMEDMTALEYAIDAHVSLKVVRSIQKACERDWKQRRTAGTKHETAERSLLELSQQNSQRLSKEMMEMTNVTPMNASMSSLKEGLDLKEQGGLIEGGLIEGAAAQKKMPTMERVKPAPSTSSKARKQNTRSARVA